MNEEINKEHQMPQGTVEELRAMVQRHRICWEVLPEQIPVQSDSPLKVGFNLNLYGTHKPEDHPVPGCDKCRSIYKDLRILAKWVIPKDIRVSRYEIEIFDNAIRYDTKRRNRPDVELTIKILHKSNFHRPIDECEVFCLNEMKEKLLKLGVPEGRWPEIT